MVWCVLVGVVVSVNEVVCGVIVSGLMVCVEFVGIEGLWCDIVVNVLL